MSNIEQPQPMVSGTIGVDTGGTFTDCILQDDQGRVHVRKILSSPQDPSRSIVEGIELLTEGHAAHVQRVVHGTTVATNALLEKQGARTALVTTRGFEDILRLGRQHRPDLYALNPRVERSWIEPAHCFGVHERMSAEGDVLIPLLRDGLDSLVQALIHANVESVAIVLLHAYANDSHERLLAEVLGQALPNVFMSTSTSISRAFREYERASTTCVNAYVGPLMSRYLSNLQRDLGHATLDVFQSNGACARAAYISQFPVHTALSGPAGGVMGARAVATALGIERIITFDMGGTSTDVSMCLGEPHRTDQATIGGMVIQVPTLDIHTVGAGGGSIAHLEHGMALHVGPQSAGSHPGPCAYGRGGVMPTVTDAHVVLGRLRPDQFLGGELSLDKHASHESFESLASELNMTTHEAAQGVLSIADAAMLRAIKVISVERGHDPRTCALVCFGGAGGLHACRLARALEMERVIVPAHPGLLSAYGMLRAPRARFFVQTHHALWSQVLDDPGVVLTHQHTLLSEAYDALGKDVACRWSVSMRYMGQSFSLDIVVPGTIESMVPGTTPDWLHTLGPTFERMHEQAYGWKSPQTPIEWVGVKLHATARASMVPGTINPLVPGTIDSTEQMVPDTNDALVSDTIWFEQGPCEARIIERASLKEAQRVQGPCVITEYSSTTVVPPQWCVEVVQGHLVLTWSMYERD